MATETLKLLSQNSPAANTLTDFYTVPAATTTVMSSIMVCNQNSTPITFRLSIAKTGAANATQQYLYYEMSVSGNDSFLAVFGAIMNTTDVMRIYSSATNVSFNLFGSEIS